MKEKYPGVRYVVVEVAEREFIRRFIKVAAGEGDKCSKLVVSSVRPAKLQTDAFRSVAGNNMPDPIYAIKALLNGMKGYENTRRSGDAFISPLSRNDLFSNKESGLIAYYKDDVSKQNWRSEDVSKAIANLKKLSVSAADQGVQIIIGVVPDKSTVYSPFFREALFDANAINVWQEMANNGVPSVDLKQSFMSEAASNVDFYLPNNTHLGNYGYKRMGELISAYIQSVSKSHQ